MDGYQSRFVGEARLAILDAFCSREDSRVANSDRAEGLRVSQAEIEQMIAAAETIRDCRRDLAARNPTTSRAIAVIALLFSND